MSECVCSFCYSIRPRDASRVRGGCGANKKNRMISPLRVLTISEGLLHGHDFFTARISYSWELKAVEFIIFLKSGNLNLAKYDKKVIKIN